jgi:hypothetical protein
MKGERRKNNKKEMQQTHREGKTADKQGIKQTRHKRERQAERIESKSDKDKGRQKAEIDSHEVES